MLINLVSLSLFHHVVQLFGRSMELEGSRSVAEGQEPSNLLESMLGTLLVFVRQCPQVGKREALPIDFKGL